MWFLGFFLASFRSTRRIKLLIHVPIRIISLTGRREDKKRFLLSLIWRVNHRFPRSNDGGYQRCFRGKFHHGACCSSLHWSPAGGASFITTQYLNSRIARYCAGNVFPLSMVFGYCLCWLKVNKLKEWCCKKIGTGSEGWWIKLLLYRIGSGFLDKKPFP